MPKRKQAPREGAGRPRLYPQGHVSRTLSIDRRADDAVAGYAEREGVSRSQAASVLILEGARNAPGGG